MRRKFLASSAVVGVLLLVLLLFAPPATASTNSTNSLSGCWAGRNGITGGHSYCASGGTEGEQRVKVYCEPSGSAEVTIYYGPWVVAKQWSEKQCPFANIAVQAQYETV